MTAYNCFIKSCFHQLNYKACQDIYESFKEEIPKQLDFSPKDEIVSFDLRFDCSVPITTIEDEYACIVKSMKKPFLILTKLWISVMQAIDVIFRTFCIYF